MKRNSSLYKIAKFGRSIVSDKTTEPFNDMCGFALNVTLGIVVALVFVSVFSLFVGGTYAMALNALSGFGFVDIHGDILVDIATKFATAVWVIFIIVGGALSVAIVIALMLEKSKIPSVIYNQLRRISLPRCPKINFED